MLAAESSSETHGEATLIDEQRGDVRDPEHFRTVGSNTTQRTLTRTKVSCASTLSRWPEALVQPGRHVPWYATQYTTW